MAIIKIERNRLVYEHNDNKVTICYPVEKEKAFEFMTFMSGKYPYRTPDLPIVKNEIERFFKQQNCK